MIPKPLIPHWAFLPLLLLLLPPSAVLSAAVRLSKSSWDGNITLLGEASLADGALSLTRNSGAGAGRALFSRPLRFLSPAPSLSPASFSSRFAFSVIPSFSHSSPGDGLAFLITSHPRRLGSPDGLLGLFSNSSGGDEAVATVAVELDTAHDAALRDINANHVALDAGSIFSAAAADASLAGVDLMAGIPIMAWVEYSAPEKAVRVWLSYSRFRPPEPLLVAAGVDLAGLLREFMYVGFAASNRRDGAALHLVHQWSFRTYGFSSSAAATPPAAAAAGGGSGDDASVEEFFNPGDAIIASPPGNRIRNLWVGLGVGGAMVLVFLVAAVFVALWYLGRSRGGGGSEDEPPPEAAADEVGRAPAMIPLEDIRSATKGFHWSKILGSGGSATVYDGVLPSSGSRVAVKRFGQVERFTGTFAAELAAVIGSCRHRNLVLLKGWCCEKGELVLVYEYMPNGSLDKVLHASPVLSWGRRWRIVLGVASALAFLHDECEKQIIHRHIRSCNILLDAEFNAKLGDLGLAELGGHGGAGSMGYLAPEYVHSGVPTDKSDVYSFGIVALEVATGRRPVDRGGALVDWVWGLWGRRRLLEAADCRLEGGFCREEMRRTLLVGLCCAHPDCKRRPSMRKVVRMLKGSVAPPALPARKPAVTLLSQLPRASQDTSSLASADAATPWFTPCVSFNQMEE